MAVFSPDVLICGAGAAGLTLAIELARRGVSFRLAERMDTAFRGSRGKGIQPRTLEIFDDQGIVDRVAARGGFYPPQREHRADGSFVDSDFMEPAQPTPAEPYALPMMLPQFLTEATMRERLAELGGRVEFGRALTGFAQDADGVTARLSSSADEETLRVRWLVGADGGRSFVRHALGIGFPGQTLGVRAVVADVLLTGLDRDAWHRFGEDAARQGISLCPLAGTEMFQIQGPVPREGEVDLSADGLTALVAARSGRDDIRVRSVSWASAYEMNARLADRYRDGRVFLIGDAAHTHPPTGGQGLNTSVQDAYNLGWKIAAVLDSAPGALLDSYEAERRPIAAGMLDLATRLLEESKRGEMKRGREVRQLDLGYRDSPLAFGERGRPGLQPGDRAPDAALRGAAGLPLRLFDLFRGTHWTLLGREVDRDAVPPRRGLRVHTLGPRGDIVDGAGHFHAAYALAAGEWLLVRPDGHIGAIVTSTQALEDCLRRVGLPMG